MNSAVKWVFMFIVFSMFFSIMNSISRINGKYSKEVTLAEFVASVEKGQISEVVFVDGYTVIGTIKNPSKNSPQKIQTVADTNNPKIFELLQKNKIIPAYVKPEKPSIFLNIVVSLIPVFLFLGLMYLMMKNQSNGGGISMFGKSNHRQTSKYLLNVTFNDVAGCEEAKEELQEVVEFLKTPLKFKRLGGRVPKGVLMQGPPGTGKTLLARAVAGEANVPFLFISGSEFVEMFVGVGASRVRDLFSQAKMKSPCVIFIDEIDAVAKQRNSGPSMGHDEREQTLNQLLVEMDGFEENSGVIVIAATNRADVLDKALLRPGRFDRIVTVENPDVKGREAILKVHVRNTVLADNVDLAVIARGTSGFSGAELENLINEAAIIATRRNKNEIEMDDLEYAKDKILMGAEKKSRVMPERERRITAYHEAGHAIVGKLLKNTDPIHKVTIVPRGRALGITQTLPEEERLSMTKERAEDFIAFLMGGRIAEEIVLNQITTGASNDIERATDLARRMVTEWGMSANLGPINYTIKQSSWPEQPKEHSQKMSEIIDQEIKSIIDKNYAKAKAILLEKIETLHQMAAVLLEKETIDSEEINKIVGV